MPVPSFSFDVNQIATRLSRLDHRRQVAFTLSCAERMQPSYRAFQREHLWGDAMVLQAAMDLGWRWLDGDSVDADILSQFGTACEEQAPDTEDFQSLVSPALDAAIAASAVMKLIETQDVEKAVEVASLSRDTVDMFVQELDQMPANAPDLEDQIRLHPLMQTELKKQSDDLTALESGGDIRQLSAGWRSVAVSNIGLL